ncbi:MAG: DUF6531 domain-containing protein, partial [Candidatus Subteraquimicrobiales bacterium]|nr:DUF6531 domain-containing protein [Candidatus Subteraquimicrobiales bacterium]
FPVGKINGNYTTAHTDFTFPTSDKIKLELARCYDSFNPKPFIFGFGWDLKMPYEIYIVNPRKTNSPILLRNRTTGKSYKYLFVEDKQSYFLVSEEKETSFTYNPQEFIKRNDDGSFAYRSENDPTYHFDPQGRLNFIADKNDRRIDYTYEKNRIVKISDYSGKSIRLIYDYKGQTKQAICPGQKVINYKYDPSGNLIKVYDNQEYIRNYTYDAFHHLIKATDEKGRVISRNSYDPLGRVIKKRQDTIVDVNGNLISRTYDDGYRLIKEEDKTGNTISYEYDRENNLSRTKLTDRQKRTTTFEHDGDERVKRIVNPLNHSIEFSHDIAGNITSFVDANKNTTNFKYDEDGNLHAFQDALGNQWKQEFDHLSRLKNIVDPLNNKIEFYYIDNKLSNIKTAEGITKYQYNNKGLLTKIVDPNGNSTEFIYDLKSNMVGIKDALGMITSI